MGEGAAQLWWREWQSPALVGPGYSPAKNGLSGRKCHRIRTCNADNCRTIAGRNGTAVTQDLCMYLVLIRASMRPSGTVRVEHGAEASHCLINLHRNTHHHRPPRTTTNYNT